MRALATVAKLQFKEIPGAGGGGSAVKTDLWRRRTPPVTGWMSRGTTTENERKPLASNRRCYWSAGAACDSSQEVSNLSVRTDRTHARTLLRRQTVTKVHGKATAEPPAPWQFPTRSEGGRWISEPPGRRRTWKARISMVSFGPGKGHAS